MPSNEYKVVIRADKKPSGEHERRYNAPTTSEVAVILTGEQHANRDIILHLKDNTLKSIAETNIAYDALQYPIIFWQGEDGYHLEIPKINPQNGAPQTKNVSSKEY